MRRRGQIIAPSLPDLEAEVMEEVWRRDEATVRDVMDSLNEGAQPRRAYTTYMTIMGRLATKGMLRRRRVGKADVFRAAMPRDRYQQVRAQRQIDALVGEFGEVALAHFARHVEECGPDRLEELRQLAAEH